MFVLFTLQLANLAIVGHIAYDCGCWPLVGSSLRRAIAEELPIFNRSSSKGVFSWGDLVPWCIFLLELNMSCRYI